MALYRETATGFIQEHAADPGAGYTAISTMPTTNIPARAEWWRDVDVYNQTSDWHPSLDSGAEDPNDNLLAIEFTNSDALVSADPSGNVTDGFLGATTEVRIMRGSQNVTLTEGWTFGLEKNPDVVAFTYTWTGTDVKTLQITGFPTDESSGYIRITATRTGSITLVRDFKILKVIQGANGTNGTDGVRGSRQIVVSGTSWSDAAAWDGILAQTGTVPVLSDLVTIANAGTGFSTSKFYTGGAYDGTWVEPSAYINGNLLVTGTVGANKLVAGSITTTYLSFTPVQAGGSASDINTYTTTIDGAKITTGTLNANRIEAGTITADRIILNGVTTDRIAANAVTAAYGSQTSGSSSANVAKSVISFTVAYTSAGKFIVRASISAITTGYAYSSGTPAQLQWALYKNSSYVTGAAADYKGWASLSVDYVDTVSGSGTNTYDFRVNLVTFGDTTPAPSSCTYSATGWALETKR